MRDPFGLSPTICSPPSIENSVEDLKSLVYGKMHRLYGENPRNSSPSGWRRSWGDIIRCHYDVIYMSAQKLVQNSLEHGYLVGSPWFCGLFHCGLHGRYYRGQFLPAPLPLPQSDCKFTTFDVPKGYGCGADLPDACVPSVGLPLTRTASTSPLRPSWASAATRCRTLT